MSKQLYRIDLNWYGENHRFFRYAEEADFALTIVIFGLAQKLNLPWRLVNNYIRDGFDRYLVQVERKKGDDMSDNPERKTPASS